MAWNRVFIFNRDNYFIIYKFDYFFNGGSACMRRKISLVPGHFDLAKIYCKCLLSFRYLPHMRYSNYLRGDKLARLTSNS